MSDSVCSFCGSIFEKPFLSLGEMELAGAFKKYKEDAQQNYPLDLAFCKNCFGVEVIEKIDPSVVFHDYFYLSSKINTLVDHFEDHAKTLAKKLDIKPAETSVLELGCNDGVLLRPLAACGYKKVIGVDPAENVVSKIDIRGVTLYAEFFSLKFVNEVLRDHGPMDVVLANNVFAHINDIRDAIRAVKKILSKNGTFVFEVHSLLQLLEQDQFDMIYHEHVYYYSVTACVKIFSLFGLSVYDAEEIGNHGGSIRIFVSHSQNVNRSRPSEKLEKLVEKEKTHGLTRYQTYLNYGAKVKAWRETFLTQLSNLKKEGKIIFGYGASGRANTLMQYCGLDDSIISVMLDDNPAKHNYFTPGSCIQIKDPNYAIKEQPDVIVIFAWTFRDEITERLRNLGIKSQLLVPLPEVKFVKRN